MDKEEIIIDDVNVAGCNFFIEDYQRANNIEGRYEHCKNVCELIGDNYFYCKMNKDCYYKQLKRLEQENKDLKKQIESDKGLITVGGKQQYQYLQRIDELEQENKELKEEIKKYSAINEQDTKDYAILRNVLEEILESAKFAQCLPCGSGNLEDCLNCADETTNNGQFCMEKRIHEIKTKCVEVLGENN